jgi:hypothetical protein
MANAPWRCSECGTINEPVANACRTCGRWPSLFDLEASAVEEVEPERLESDEARKPQVEVEEPPTFETETFEPKTFDLDIGTTSEPAPEDTKRRRWIDVDVRVETDEVDPETNAEESHRGRRWASFLVPIAFVVYLAISIIFGER